MTETQLPDLATGYLRVVCRLGRLHPDAADTGDVPDVMTQGGTVTLTPGVKTVRITELDGRSRLVTLDTTTCQIVPDTGELVGPTGVAGVQVIDPASGIDPSDWTWAATINPAVGEPRTVTFDGSVSVAGVVDVAAAADIPSAEAVAGLTARVEALEATIDSVVVADTTLTPDGSGGLIIDQI